jgi:hypothetical protein
MDNPFMVNRPSSIVLDGLPRDRAGVRIPTLASRTLRLKFA